MLKNTCLFFLLLFSASSVAQDESLLTSLTIPTELYKNANAVVRYNDIDIAIMASNQMVYTNKRIVTILNASGDGDHGAVVHYDKNIRIKKLEAKIYDVLGKEIKKIKKNDFEDVSAVDGFSLYTDNRVKYLNYTPVNYPYTVVFETEIEYDATAFIPGWYPIEGFYISTENASYRISNPSGIGIKMDVVNFEGFDIQKQDDFEYTAAMLKAIEPEAYSPAINEYVPQLKVALTEFEMGMAKGVNTNWNDFGKWMDDKLIQGTQALPDKVIAEIESLTAMADTNMKKAKIVYNYMQDKTRYISVQIGIGGWKPMLASDVDRLGYGDCKGLTNYTKALMDAVGVESYYTVIYGGKEIRNMDKSFSSLQGNHVILCVPDGSDYIWLECTSQSAPFGYIANFTDDRDALIITPEGGKIVHTKRYKTEDNLLDTRASVQLEPTGNFDAVVELASHGAQYGYHEGVQRKTNKNQALHYKNYWSHLTAIAFNAMEFHDDQNEAVFNERLVIHSERYASKTGDRLLLQPNFFNRVENAPARYENRLLPFELDRGFVFVDEYEILLPETLEVETLLDTVQLSTKFGEYTVSMVQEADDKLVYHRKFVVYDGLYDKEDYEAFRAFWLEVVKNDKSKIALKYKT